MKNIFIEGIPGSGKSTLLTNLQNNLPELKFYKEGDISPVDLAWCAYMSKHQYGKALKDWPQFRNLIEENSIEEEDSHIVAYTRIHADNHDFYKYMEQFEIYGGRRDIKEFRTIVIHRFHQLNNSGNVFECAFFQNIIEELMLYATYNDEEILNFYKELVSNIKVKDYRVIRLLNGNVKECIQHIREERVNEKGEEIWYNLMMGYLRQSPYGKAHGFNEFDDMIKHFNRRINLEKRILDEVLPYKYLDVKSKEYQIADIIAFLK